MRRQRRDVLRTGAVAVAGVPTVTGTVTAGDCRDYGLEITGTSNNSAYEIAVSRCGDTTSVELSDGGDGDEEKTVSGDTVTISGFVGSDGFDRWRVTDSDGYTVEYALTCTVTEV
ncbi:MAG: hypothetical protein ABEI99_11255 [Halobaculum sp.]